MLCGSYFGLPFRRHRLFESNRVPRHDMLCKHSAGDFSHDHGKKQAESVYRKAMNCDWMTVLESRQSIPPVYTEFIGTQLLRSMD